MDYVSAIRYKDNGVIALGKVEAGTVTVGMNVSSYAHMNISLQLIYDRQLLHGNAFGRLAPVGVLR